MSPASINLSRRAVACRHWRWEPGMRSEIRTSTLRSAYRWLSGPTDERPWGLVVIVEDHRGWPARTVATLQPGPHDLPDLDDPATVGCLMALVREAHGGAVVITEGNGWWSIETETTAQDDDDLPSFVHGLVWALEAAP